MESVHIKNEFRKGDIPLKLQKFFVLKKQNRWLLRNKIRWAKQVLIKKQNKTMGSVMPTSVKDRFNESGEELYFFVKNKKYYSDLDAVRLKNQVLGITDFRENVGGFINPAKLYKNNSKYFGTKYEQGKRDWQKEEAEGFKMGSVDSHRAALRGGLKSLAQRMKNTKNKNTKESRAYNIKKLLSEVRLGIKPNIGMEPNLRQQKAKEQGMHTFYSHSRRNKVNDPRGTHEGGPGSWRDFKDNPKNSYPKFVAKQSELRSKFDPRPKTGAGSLGYGKEVMDYYKDSEIKGNIMGKNLPSVWLIQSEPHNFQKELGPDISQDHFAVFPQALLEIPIKFGCPEKGIVLDPFIGSGTTALVARNLGRNFVGIELNKNYIEIANKRLRQEVIDL